jgi:hypothetical protein
MDHSGIKVKCLAVSPSAITDSTLTGSDGSYSLTVEVGIYNIEFSKTGYISQSLPNYFISQDTTLPDVTLLFGTLVDISGIITGTLSAAYVYRVVGDLTIPDTSSLTIEPGVQLRFDGEYNLYCYGPINAVGTVDDSIYFTSNQPSPGPGDWGGVYVYYNDYDSTNLANQFVYCVFTYGRGNAAQLEINSSLASVNRSSFRHGDRGDVYFTNSYGVVKNTQFSGGTNNSWNINNNHSEVYYRNILLTNFNDAFYSTNNADVELKTSSFLNGNRRALYTDGWSTILVDSCLFNNIYNDWVVQFHDNSLARFTNNILDDVHPWNVLGIWSNAHVDVINNYIEGTMNYADYDNNTRNQNHAPQIAYNVIVRNEQNNCIEGLRVRDSNLLIQVHHNTIVGFTCGNRGINVYNDDSLAIHSNIVFGNSNAINSNNNGYMDYSYNCFFANNNLMQDNDFPAGFSQVVTTNANGDPSDIYANIFLDPEFEDASNNDFDLKVTSPAINAGSPAYIDADSTISDIGARPYFFPFVLEHTPLTTTSDTIGPYIITADVTPTQGQTISNTLYYKTTPNGFWTLQGDNNTSLYFNGNGSHDHVIIPYDPSTGSFNALTIEAWVKPVTANYGYTIYSNRSTSGSESILLYYNAWDRRIRWHIDTGYGFQQFDGNTRLEPGQWYHVAAVYDGSQSTLYVNGNYDGSMSVSGTIYDTNGDPFIGHRRDHGSDWNGYIDEFRIWNVARTQGEIQAYMGRELFGTEAGLVGYWNFNEAGGSAVHDLTGNHNDGSIIGAYFTEEDPSLLPAEGFNLGEWTSVSMSSTTGNTYSGNIPGQSLNTTVDYFIQVTDGVDTLTSPYYVPYEFHRFHVSLFESLVSFTAIQQNDGTIALSWDTPIPTSGSLTGFNLYYDTQPDVSIDNGHLLSALTSGQNSYIHTGLTEGETYYYKLTALLDDGSETLIAPEINAMSNNSTLLLAEGIVQVENASEHSGVKIVFTPETTAGLLDSVYTDSTGYFSIILPVSIYTVDITKEGCVPVHIPSLYLSDNYNFGVIQLLARPIQELYGIVTDTLTSDFYYLVTGNLTVQNNDTLFIEPGTVIAFDGYYRMDVYGKLFAEGTEGDSIYFTSNAFQPSPGDWEYIRLINNAGGSRFEYCVFEYGDGWSEWVGSGILRIEVPDVMINRSRFSYNQRGAISFYGGNSGNNRVKNSHFTYNYQDPNQDGGVINVRNWSSNGGILITENVFYQNYGRDIASYDCFDGLTISYNAFYSDNNYDNLSIYHRQTYPLLIANNSFSGRAYIRIEHDCYGRINNNTIEHSTNYTHGIYVNQSSMTVESNTITNCTQGIYYQNNRSFAQNVLYPHVIRNNLINGTYHAGIIIRDNSRDIDIYNNTIINADLDNNNGSDAAALYFYNNAGDIFLHSNAVTDSRYAMYLDNTGNMDIYNNDFWNNDNLFQGSGYPQGLGTVTSQNNNGDPSDIYSNIYLNPEFVSPDSSNFYLQSTSPLIDAGYILFHDPDGTILDIGALYFDHGNPHNLTVSDEDENSVTLQWSTVARDSLTGYNLYSKLATETDYVLAQFTPDTFGTVNGLTNNLDYDFVVTSVYPNSESIFSINVAGRPGLAEIGITPEYLIKSVTTSDSTAFDFSISNNGSKDLDYWLNEDSLLNRFTGYYYNNSNWDDFSNLLTVREDSVINFNWDDNNQIPPGVPNNNFHVRWEGQIRLTQSGNYYFEYCVDDGFRVSFNGNWFIWTGGCCWCSNNQYFDAGVYDVVIDYYAYGNPNYLYLKWQPPGDNLDWFRLPNPITPDMFFKAAGIVHPDSTRQNQLTMPPRNSGVYTTFLPFSSNDKSDPYLTLPLLQMVDYTFIPAVQFNPGTQTGAPFYLVIDDAYIDGDPLQPGDELAIFDSDSCVGAGMFDGNLPFVVRAYGFADGNPYSVKAWDNSQYRYATALVENYTVGEGNFFTNGFNEVTLSATVYVTNQISLTPSQFNLVSLNHYPQNPDASAVFGDIAGLEIVYDDEGGAFIPEYNINTIGSVDITEGYYLFFDSSGVNLTYNGLPISVSDWPLLLQAHRWNYFSYLKDQPADVSVVFATLADSIDIIQADDGGAWIPSLSVNTLGNLTPGKGYTTFLSATTDQTFIYPTTQGVLSRQLASGPTPKHFTFTSTGLPYTVVIQQALFEGRPLEEGDEIGIFDGEGCVGAGVFTSTEPLIITAWQGNKDLDVAGFAEGNPITLRVYSRKYRQEYSLSATFRRDAERYFKNTPYTVVKRTNTNGGIIPEVYALGHNYPNPFNPITRIPYQLPEDTQVRISVYNLLGQEVVTLVNEFQLAAYHTAVWNGRDASGREVPSGVYIYRMETPSFHKTQKLVLLK